MPVMKMCDKKQHYYDSERYSSCPYCKQDGKSVNPGINSMQNTSPVSPTNPVQNFNPPPTGGKVHNKTLTLGTNENSAVPFVVGWLICIEGEDYGKDFRLHAENNYIGRDNPECDINLNDGYVSGKHFVINYDTLNGEFSIYIDGGKNAVYVNNKSLLKNTAVLKKGDIIKVGKTLLVFIPLDTSIVQWKWNQ